MAYSKAKLKSNGNKASPCFKPYLIGNMSDKCLPTRTLLKFYSDTFLLAFPVSWEYQTQWEYYMTSLVTESLAFLNSIKSWYNASLYSHFYKVFDECRIPRIWSLFDLLRLNPHWWFTIIPSAYGVNLGSMMVGNDLHVVCKSDMPLLLLQSVLSSFLSIGTMMDSFHSSGNSFLLRIGLISFWISERIDLPLL
jgi:hypothetical protein